MPSEKLDLASACITDEQKAKLKTLFPEAVTEGGKVDFERLRLTLGDATVDTGKERCGLNWPGKADCFKTIQRPSMATLIPARDESVNFVANIIWQKKFAPQNDAKFFSDNHDHILLFAKHKESWSRNRAHRTFFRSYWDEQIVQSWL